MSKAVEVGTREMRKIFEMGVENYTPTLGGHELREEGGVTENSLMNIASINEALNCKPIAVEFGPNWTVFFSWPGLNCYTATGFSWGWSGGHTSSAGLAEAMGDLCDLATDGDPQPEDWTRYVRDLDAGRRGLILPKYYKFGGFSNDV